MNLLTIYQANHLLVLQNYRVNFTEIYSKIEFKSLEKNKYFYDWKNVKFCLVVWLNLIVNNAILATKWLFI